MVVAWTDQKERSNPFALRLICWVALHISRGFARFWLWPITFYYYLFAPQVRRASRSYLRRIPGHHGDMLDVIRHIHHFAAVVLDRVYFLTDQFHKFTVTVYGEEHLSQAIANGHGVILLGAHVGSFEILRCLGVRRERLPLKILMHLDHNAMITRVLDELNPEVARSVINLADPSALMQMKESLDQGYMIGILGDRVSMGERQLECQLLNQTVAMPAGPFTFAEMLNVPVIGFFGIYLGANRYAVHFIPLSPGQTVPREQRTDAVAALTQNYVATIESMLHQYPYNWFNFYDYWGETHEK